VAKMRVQIPRQLREQMEQAIAPVIEMAQAAYRRAQSTAAPLAALGGNHGVVHPAENQRVSETIRVRPKTLADLKVVRSSTLHNMWTIEELLFELERVATKEERLVV